MLVDLLISWSNRQNLSKAAVTKMNTLSLGNLCSPKMPNIHCFHGLKCENLLFGLIIIIMFFFLVNVFFYDSKLKNTFLTRNCHLGLSEIVTNKYQITFKVSIEVFKCSFECLSTYFIMLLPPITPKQGENSPCVAGTSLTAGSFVG